ncbi:MAG: FAD:protein FMN transferase [Nocardioidaceae bacterium]|nr:MAG: FAD:protein FMN transferase [Nocardioidaceae bacterium]
MFEAIGTQWQLTLDEAAFTPALTDQISSLIARFDQTWSRFRDDSVINQLRNAPTAVCLPTEADELFRLYAELDELTDGAVNPLVGAGLESLGYDARYSFVDRETGIQTAPRWSELRWDPPVLEVPRPVVLDVGAAGKGLLVDLVTSVLRDKATGAFTVDAGGDLFRHDPDHSAPIRVGLEHPFATDHVVGVVELAHGALCASAVNRRMWGDGLHHILDARTGRPTSGIAATWALAPTCMLADGLASALFFVPPATIAQRYPAPVHSLRLGIAGLEADPDFPGELFP